MPAVLLKGLSNGLHGRSEISRYRDLHLASLKRAAEHQHGQQAQPTA
jgi:hypothetical protein